MARPKLLPDNFTLSLVVTVGIASVLPCRGNTAIAFEWLTNIAIGLLFFLHGAKLPREAVVAAVRHWRLHVLVLGCTFVLFPVLGLVLRPVLMPLVTPALYTGVLFLCILPSTVQSSIALTSIAKGNVPAAVCSASASTLLGIFITPIWAGVLIHLHGGGSPLSMIGSIIMQLLLPFGLGQLLRGWINSWLQRNKGVLKYVDQGSILLVVYGAFSAAVIEGLWHQIPLLALGGLLIVDAVILALALSLTSLAGKRLGFDRADQITIMFCGSKKSLAAGVAMAKVLFASSAIGAIVLPLMLFHQIQLMTCSVLAQRFGARDLSRETPAAKREAAASSSSSS
jgi:sodium/bile acid cotransporter 7